MKGTFKRAVAQTNNSSSANHGAYRGVRILAPSVLLILTVFSISAWAQTTISPGDIVVTLPNAFGGSGSIVKVNPSNGAQTTIACNPSTTTGCPITGPAGFFQQPVSLAIESTGNIVVADRNIPGVIRVNPQTGAQTLLASGAPFIDPFGLTIGSAGVIYVTDTGCATHASTCPTGPSTGNTAKVFSINPTTGTVALVSSGGFLNSPFGIDAEANGNLVVTDANSAVAPLTKGGIIRINPTTGIQTVLHAGTAGSDGCAFGIAVKPMTGDIYNSIWNTNAFPGFGCSPGSLWVANPVTGANTDFSPQTSVAWRAPFGMVVDTNNTILVVDEFYQALYRVNPNGTFAVPPPLSQFTAAVTDVDVYTNTNTPPPLSGATLSVTKDDGVSTVTAGDGVTHTYTITVRNTGTVTAVNVTLTDTWPSGFNRTSLSCTPTSGTSTGNGNFACSLGNLAPGATVMVTANYTVPSSTPAGTQTNTVSASGTGTNTATASKSTTVVTSLTLAATKTDNSPAGGVTAGDGVTYTYTITITNNGPSDAANVTLTDTWPSGFNRTSLSCAPTSGTSTGNGNFTCSLGTLAASASTMVTATYTVPSSTPAGPQTNSVSVSSSTSGSNTATASKSTTVATSLTLAATKTDNSPAGGVTAGDGVTYTYTITITNNGPSDAANVTLTDTWPSGFNRTSLSCAPTSGMSTGNGNFTCPLGTLVKSAQTTVTATYTVPSSTPAGSQTNSVSVTSSTSGSNTTTASKTTTVNSPPPPPSADLMISMTGSPNPVNVGNTLSYTLTVTNNGPNTAANLTVTDTLPAGVTVQSMTLSGWACTQSGQTVTCTLPSLAAAGTSSFTINVTAPSQPGTIVNSATVSSTTADPNSANNTASVSTTVNAPLAKWTGSGKIAVTGGTANFGFKAQRQTVNGSATGSLNYQNNLSGLTFSGATITSLVVVGSELILTGTGMESIGSGPQAGPYNFKVTAQDLSLDGRSDTFKIEISDPTSTTEGSTTTPIVRGNIKQYF